MVVVVVVVVVLPDADDWADEDGDVSPTCSQVLLEKNTERKIQETEI